MELLYLLSSIVYHVIISFALSLFLPFHCIYQQLCQSQHQEEAEAALFLYQGSVWHERKRPVHHSFRYNVRYALIDLDRAPTSTMANHLSAQQARQITATSGPVFLLTIPPSVGYEQNPLSVYYCYEFGGGPSTPTPTPTPIFLKKCIAEVTNTPWGERVSFVFNPDSDSVAKPLHVSPFMDMLGNWKMRANAPGDDLFLTISVQHPKLGDYFTATLTAKRVSSRVFSPALFFWLIPQKVALWIYWQAVKLWWKNVGFIQHPRYVNPNYRDEASTRDGLLRCCGQTNTNIETKGKHVGDRWCVWRDAQWPWN